MRQGLWARLCLMGGGEPVQVWLVEEHESISPWFSTGGYHVGDPFCSRVALLQAWPLKCKSSEGEDEHVQIVHQRWDARMVQGPLSTTRVEFWRC